jgi:hypothetical protein
MRFKNLPVGQMFSIIPGVLRPEDVYRKTSDIYFEGYSIHCNDIDVKPDQVVYLVTFV